MLIPAHLFFIGQMVFFALESSSHPSKRHWKRQAESPTHKKLTRNAIPIVPGDYDLPGLQLIQNKEIIYPKNVDSRGNAIYFQPNGHNDAKRDDSILSNLKEVRGIVDLFGGGERRARQRDQRKQPKSEEMEPCGHLQRNDYNMLSSVIGKMSPEARNALIDALLKTLMDKSKVSAVKSSDNKLLHHSLDAALQPPLRINSKSDGPLVQPFSLTMEREKLRDLYKYLSNEKFRSGIQKTNVMVNLGELLQESMRKECGTTKKPCCPKHNATKAPEAETARQETQKDNNAVECTATTMAFHEEAEVLDESCNCDQYADSPPNSIVDFPGDRVINLTQIFNVHPKVLIVNAGQLAPTDITGILNETAKSESENPTTQTTKTTTNQPTTTSTLACPTQVTSMAQSTTHGVTNAHTHPSNSQCGPNKSPNNHRKCTRRPCCRHGCRRYDRRGRLSPVRDLIYTYYVDIDDPPIMDD